MKKKKTITNQAQTISYLADGEDYVELRFPAGTACSAAPEWIENCTIKEGEVICLATGSALEIISKASGARVSECNYDQVWQKRHSGHGSDGNPIRTTIGRKKYEDEGEWRLVAPENQESAAGDSVVEHLITLAEELKLSTAEVEVRGLASAWIESML